jgi:hypothetical protein
MDFIKDDQREDFTYARNRSEQVERIAVIYFCQSGDVEFQVCE